MWRAEAVREGGEPRRAVELLQDGAGFSVGSATQLVTLFPSLAPSLSCLIFKQGIAPVSEARTESYMRSWMCMKYLMQGRVQ